ncbi:hypothetical protein KC967_00455 [Candidatus Saccharibacteria bacterium]|nr:hypothetical protein [Candidatus Saccharibacteria bacterium]
MNIGDVAATNIYTGGQIMQLSEDQNRLSLEFDTVVVSCLVYVMKAYYSVPDSVIKRSIKEIFDNTEISEKEKRLYLARFNDYDLNSLRSISEKFYSNLPHVDLSDSWRTSAVSSFEDQLKMLESALIRFIKDESRAASKNS